MKHITKILALALALIMVLGLATTASAATPYTVTITNAAGHTYQIYQIFTGTLAEVDGKEVLSNLQYGADYTPDGVAVNTPVPQSVLDTIETTATSIEPTGDGLTMATSGDTATITVEKAGYYMIKDVTIADDLPDGDTSSAVIFRVVGETTVTSKHTGTTIEKKVEDINDSTGLKTADEDKSTWIDSADYDIGDTVPFQSTANFEGMDNYTSYKVEFTDIMAAGLTYKKDMQVFVDGVDCTGDFDISFAKYTSTDEYNGGTKITVSCNNIKPLANGNAATIVLKYNATLNEEAKLGAPGNPNKIRVKTIPGGGGEEEETPWDVNIVFTYKVVVNKVDKDKKPLAGAEFTLEKFVVSENGTQEYTVGETIYKGEWVAKETVEATPETVFTFKGLDDGHYRLTETVAPAGYNKIEPIEFDVVAEHVIVADNPALTSLSGDAAGGEIEFETLENKEGLTTDVINQRGVVLPETGGIGTTIFYVIGGLLAVAAVVLLVTKKRMASAE